MTAIIELDDVRVEFRSGWGANRRDVIAMAGDPFQVEQGETLGLVGESGSGKTTTGAVALGLQRVTRGTVRFEGAPLARSLRSRAGRVQAVQQHPQWARRIRRPTSDRLGAGAVARRLARRRP